MVAEHLGDAPGDRMVVGDPHHQPAFSVHQPRHFVLPTRRHSGVRAERANPESRYLHVTLDSGSGALRSAIADLSTLAYRSRVNPRSVRRPGMTGKNYASSR